MTLLQLVGRDYARYRDAMGIREPVPADELILFTHLLSAVNGADREWAKQHERSS